MNLYVNLKNTNSFKVTVQNDNQSETALSVELTDYSLEQFDFEGESYTVADFGSAPATYDAGWPVLPISVLQAGI